MRIAGYVRPRKQTQLGYVIMMCATLVSLGYNFLVREPTVPWAVLPQALNAMGIALTFPVLSLKMLDRYPQYRGSASSMQAFLWGLLTSAIAALASPWFADDHQTLALGAALMVCLGFACWQIYASITPEATACPAA